MTSENIVPFAGHPAPELMPGQRLRRPPPDDTYARKLLAAAEAAAALSWSDTMTVLSEKAWEHANSIVREVIPQLLARIDLAGLEVCDEVGEPYGTILGVSEAEPDCEMPIFPWVHASGRADMSLGEFVKEMTLGHYVRLPGSRAYGLTVILEAARAKLGEARQ
jgi:hypothetical protein